MSMELLCFVIMSTICVNSLGHATPEELQLQHSPPSLYALAGETAVFTCNFSAVKYTDTEITWHRTQNSTSKIADYNSSESDHISIKQYKNSKKAELYITNLKVNDSGEYHCSLLQWNRSNKITLSNKSKLYVTEGDQVIRQIPQVLLYSPSETAVFTCNISGVKYFPDDIHWFKVRNNISHKIADLKTSYGRRIYILAKWKSKMAELHIKNLSENDSGDYYCALPNNTGRREISNKSTLKVQGIPGSVTPRTGPSTNNITIISASVVLIILLLLIGTVLIMLWRKRRTKTQESQLKHLEKPTQDPAVYAVDYGVLEFGSDRPYRKSAELSTLEQVEYASIMFPQGTPSLGACRERDSACSNISWRA